VDRLTPRVTRSYAAALSAALVAVTLCSSFIAYAWQIRVLDSQTRQVLQTYVTRAEHEGAITTKRQVARIIANAEQPGWVLIISTGHKRFVVQWPPGHISSVPRTPIAPWPFPWNFAGGLATIAGSDMLRRAIVDGTEIALDPVAPLHAIVTRTLWFTAVALLLVIVASVLAAAPLARAALRPLSALQQALAATADTGEVAQSLPELRRHGFEGLITTYNRAVEAVKSAHAERDAAEARTHQFIADAGHQLRTPLTVLSGFISILLTRQLRHPDDGPKILQRMQRQIAIMKELVERMMLLESWQSGENPAREVTDIAAFVTSVVDPIAASHPERVLRIDAVNGAAASIDAAELTYAVSNLLENAIKYSSNGPISIDIATADNAVCISIADEGPGIPADQLPLIFDRFYRGARRDVPGSGLGLSIARTAVERAGGTLIATSAPGKGSRFTITLPRKA
jgi:signal transduction histidine kinase